MDSKFIIFVVLASCLQVRCSSIPPSKALYGLSKTDSLTLSEIIADQDTTLSTFIDSVAPVFDLIEKYASKIIYNLEDVSGNNFDESVTAAIASLKASVDSSLDGIVKSIGASDSDVEEARNGAYADVEGSFAAINSTLTLAASGNFAENRAQVENYRESVQDYFKSGSLDILNVFRKSLQTTNHDILDIYNLAVNRSLLGVKHTINAIFNAIVIYGTAADAGQADASLITVIQNFRENALDGAHFDVESKFSLLRTWFVNSKLSNPVNWGSLHANQFALARGFTKLKETIANYFGTMLSYVQRVALGLEDSGRTDFSSEDAAAARAIAKVAQANEVFLYSVLVAQPDSENAVTQARETLANVSATIVSGIYNILDIVQDPDISYDAKLTQIGEANDAAAASLDIFVGAYFDAIRNGKTYDTKIENEFKDIYNDALEYLTGTVVNIFDGVKVVAEAVNAGEADGSDFAAVIAANEKGDATLDFYTQKISAAGLVQLQAPK